MNRSEMIKNLRGQSDLTSEEASWLVKRFFELLCEGLARDGRIELRGFGVFKLNQRNQAGFMNPVDQRYYGALELKTIKFYPTFPMNTESSF